MTHSRKKEGSTIYVLLMSGILPLLTSIAGNDSVLSNVRRSNVTFRTGFEKVQNITFSICMKIRVSVTKPQVNRDLKRVLL